MNDGELLRRYHESGDDQAFGELVNRHLDLVHATALRRLGDPHAAADVSQSVFCLLWRKASRLYASTDLTGWLHRATCYKVAEALRAGRRRRFHEQEAATMHAEPSTHADPWADVAPHLDEALDRLGEAERQLILWRFFRRESLRELGGRLGVSEDAARMRLGRALERLRQQLVRAGAAIGPSALGDVLEARTIQPAPAALRDDVMRRIRQLRQAPSLPQPASRLADWARALPRRPAALGIASLVFVGAFALWRIEPWSNSEDARQTDAADAAEARATTADPPSGSIPGARITAVAPRPLSAADLEALLDDLRRILASPIQDNVLPPEDLRRAVHALAGHPDETYAVLASTFHGPDSVQVMRERAIWGLWLLGEAAPSAVPAIVTELTGVIRARGQEGFWWHAADVLRHLGPPEPSLAGVVEAVQANPAAALGTMRFWEGAVHRYPQATEALLRPWLEESGSRRFVAARILVKVADVDKAALLPIVEAGLDDATHQSSALEALKDFGPTAAQLAPGIRTRLAEADRSGQVWLRQQLIEVLAAIAPESRSELPEVDRALRVEEQASILRRKTDDDTATVGELAAGLCNPKVGWMAAMALEELGPSAAGALPALRQALAEPGQLHRHYLAKAIKAIEPGSPKPLVERDELLATLRALSDTAAELAPSLDPAQREEVAEFIRDAGNHTPEELAGFAGQLEAVHPRLRAVFVSGLIAVDPTMESVFAR